MVDKSALSSHSNQQKRAVALSYGSEEDELPRVLAKGMGALAELIEILAKTHDVPIAKNDELADLVAKALPNIDEDSCEFQIVAEVLCYLYHLESVTAEESKK